MRRDGDLFWRLKYRSRGSCGGTDGEATWLHVVFNLEHISGRRRWTALDMATYKVMAWQKLARSRTLKPKALLPAVVSVVIYTGDTRWPEVTPLTELVEQMEEAPPGTDIGDVVVPAGGRGHPRAAGDLGRKPPDGRTRRRRLRRLKILGGAGLPVIRAVVAQMASRYRRAAERRAPRDAGDGRERRARGGTAEWAAGRSRPAG